MSPGSDTVHPDSQGPDVIDARWRSAGDRIQLLLDASAGGGTAVRERAEELARELTDLYGAALARIMQLAADADPGVIERFANDDLVASLLLVHELHPHGLEQRIENALDSVRPYLGSHGGDVALLEVVDGPDGSVVRLQFAGSCKSCPSSAVTLELTVEDAVRAAAPEMSSIEVVAAEKESASTVIPIDSLMKRVQSTGNASAAWHQVPDIADLEAGEVAGFLVAGVPILACRIGDHLYAYHDRCGSCQESLAGAALHRRMGSAIGEAVLRCPHCHSHFDAVHAGGSLDESADTAVHLDPIPLLTRDGVLCAAVVAEATEVT